jgi:hypothetical protein
MFQLAGVCEMLGGGITNLFMMVFDSICWPIGVTMFTQFMPMWAPALGGLCQGVCNACVAPCM